MFYWYFISDYDDNLEYDVNGIVRMNSRDLSQRIFDDGSENDPKHNVQFTTTAQNLAHDTSRAKVINPGELPT